MHAEFFKLRYASQVEPSSKPPIECCINFVARNRLRVKGIVRYDVGFSYESALLTYISIYIIISKQNENIGQVKVISKQNKRDLGYAFQLGRAFTLSAHFFA